MLKKQQTRFTNPKSQSELELDDDGECDIYSIEEIFERDLMSPQHRRFGSPDFAVKSDSMMFDIPTSHLEEAKPGVQIFGGDKTLKGPKYDASPYFDWEVEESEEEEDSSFEYQAQNKPNAKSAHVLSLVDGFEESDVSKQYSKLHGINKIEDDRSVSSQSENKSKTFTSISSN